MMGLYFYQFYYLTDRVSASIKVFILVLHGVTLGGFGYYLWEEINQYYHNRPRHPGISTIRSLLEHFLLDLWNFVDVLILCTAAVGIVLRFVFNDDTEVGRCFLAIGSIFMWFKVLYFLRPFSTSGPLGEYFNDQIYNLYLTYR